MKKYIFGVALALALVVAPFVSFAQTDASCPIITINLSLGSTGLDVTALQKYLIDEGLLVSDGPTGYFGPLTKTAVTAWQKAHNIIGEAGFWGPLSRASLASLCPSDNGNPVAKFTGSPVTLRDGKILASFSGTVTASGGDVFVFSGFPFGAMFVNEAIGAGTFVNSCKVNSLSLDYGAPLPTTVDRYGQLLTIIKSGASAQYKVEVSCDTEQMFSGIYHAELTNLNYSLSSSEASLNVVSLPINIRSTSSQYIIGEKGPWLSGKYEYLETSAPSVKQIKIYGERLAGSKLYVNEREASTFSMKNPYISPDGSYILIDDGASFSAGNYLAYVQNAVGKSNTISVNLGSVSPSDQIIVLSPNGGETYAPGSVVPIRFSTNLTDKQTSGFGFKLFRRDGQYGSDAKTFALDIVSGWLGGSPYNWTIPADHKSGQYYIYAYAQGVSSAPGNDNEGDFSDNYFTINTVANPNEIAPRINAISGNLYPYGWVKLSGSRLTTDVRITKSGNSSVFVPLNLKDVYGNGTRIDFQIPMDIVPGAYYINIYSRTGMKSPTLQFKVIARPTASAQARTSQLASIASAIQALINQLKAQ